MIPDPALVLDTVRSLVSDAWPTTEPQRRGWFAAHGIEPTQPVGDYPCWGTGIPGWGDTTTCWSSDDERLLGVGWFLWDAQADAQAAADQLRARLDAVFGASTCRVNEGDHHWCEWRLGDTLIELTAGSRDEPQVQVHLTDATAVEARDQPKPTVHPDDLPEPEPESVG